MQIFPFRTPVLRVDQPIGSFYVGVLPAKILLEVAFSDVMAAKARPDGSGYDLTGTQRLPQPKRLPQIAEYIDRADAAFPNTIILAGNYRADTGLIEDEYDGEEDIEEGGDDASRAPPPASKAWEVVDDGGRLTLIIPTQEKLAAIIDGQHRLFAFADVKLHERLEMELVCSIFLDLPKPYQAQLFATINSTQKAVDKSLTYELFGYNIADEGPALWTPDKLAVFLTRKLSTEEGSPLRGRILIAPRRDELLHALNAASDWRVSTAVVTEGIMRLFTSNPKRDSNFLLSDTPKERRALNGQFKDRSPLRWAYVAGNDSLIYTLVVNYLSACERVFWSSAAPDSFIIRTVGIQALFDVLNKIANKAISNKDVSIDYFARALQPAGDIDFAGEFYRKASGAGRAVIRRAIETAL